MHLTKLVDATTAVRQSVDFLNRHGNQAMDFLSFKNSSSRHRRDLVLLFEVCFVVVFLFFLVCIFVRACLFDAAVCITEA